MRFLRVALVVLLGLVSLPAFSQDIVIGTEDGAALWGDEKGQGAANDIVNAAFDAAGLKVTLKVLPYARAKTLTEDGSIAGCFTMGSDEAVAGKTVFNATPLRSNNYFLVQNNKAPLKIKTLSDIPMGATIGTVRGYIYSDDIMALPSQGYKFEESDSDGQNLKKLASGRLNLALIPADELTTTDYYLKSAGVDKSCSVIWQTPKPNQGYVGFSVKNKDGAKAMAAFEIGIKKIIANGTYKTIIANWQKKLPS